MTGEPSWGREDVYIFPSAPTGTWVVVTNDHVLQATRPRGWRRRPPAARRPAAARGSSSTAASARGAAVVRSPEGRRRREV